MSNEFKLNTVDDLSPVPRKIYSETILSCQQFDSVQLVELMLWVQTLAQTGQLTINYTQGKIAGTVEWKTRDTRINVDSPLSPAVKS